MPLPTQREITPRMAEMFRRMFYPTPADLEEERLERERREEESRRLAANNLAKLEVDHAEARWGRCVRRWSCKRAAAQPPRETER